MTGQINQPRQPKKLGAVKRSAVAISSDDLIQTGPLSASHAMPWLIQPRIGPLDLAEWGEANRDWLHSLLYRHGAILLRGFGLQGAADLTRFIENTSRQWAEYREPATPRQHVAGNIFTSTEYPPEQRIFLHNENSHCDSWPAKLYFLCLIPASEGGETPLVDCRKLYARITPEVKERFSEKKIMYVRHFGGGLGFSWQTVFGTDSPSGVDAYCQQHGMQAEWRDGGRLRVRYVREAVARHPVTGDIVWFNHGTFFNIATVEPTLRETLLSQYAPEDLPYNTYYGDGSLIEPAVLEHLRDAYLEETVCFPYETGDLLMIDNMLVAHGRSSFKGERCILVGMSDPIDVAAASVTGA